MSAVSESRDQAVLDEIRKMNIVAADRQEDQVVTVVDRHELLGPARLRVEERGGGVAAAGHIRHRRLLVVRGGLDQRLVLLSVVLVRPPTASRPVIVAGAVPRGIGIPHHQDREHLRVPGRGAVRNVHQEHAHQHKP